MTIDQDRIKERSSYGLLAAAIIASVALGIVIWQVCGYGWESIVYTVFVVTGVFLVLASFRKDVSFDFAPSDSSFYLVVGVLLATVGIIGFVTLLADVNTWLLVAVFILVFAIMMTYRSLSKKG